MLRGLAILLVFTFTLLRVDSVRALEPFGGDASIGSVKAPESSHYSIESKAGRAPLGVHVDLLRLAVFHAGYSFGLLPASRALASSSLDSSVERLVDRRALIRRLGRVQHRSSSPVG